MVPGDVFLAENGVSQRKEIGFIRNNINKINNTNGINHINRIKDIRYPE
jgi:hypothetical protein